MRSRNEPLSRRRRCGLVHGSPRAAGDLFGKGAGTPSRRCVSRLLEGNHEFIANASMIRPAWGVQRGALFFFRSTPHAPREGIPAPFEGSLIYMSANPLRQLNQCIISCRRCPRLVRWREKVAREKRAAYRDEIYWGRPITGFGDLEARVLICGLAPAAHG